MSSERGAATVLVVAIVAAIMTVTAVVLPVLGMLVQSARAANAADAAALAAADAVAGVVDAVPCELAARAAALGGAELTGCALDGPVADVSVSIALGPFDTTATARAGPPGWPG
ncbi:helicase [Agromyces archimandritae]|uniref:Helicase n=1 Tax=Agromyces archimandritae TaxID=2781962 RepID=A0A975IQ10_9MICO|nr:helicase [Agromyces archimandritae]